MKLSSRSFANTLDSYFNLSLSDLPPSHMFGFTGRSRFVILHCSLFGPTADEARFWRKPADRQPPARSTRFAPVLGA